MNVKVISRNVGYALLVSALFMFLSILVSVAEGNDSALGALLVSFVITFTVGVFPFIFVRKASVITLKDGFMIIFLSWMMSFIFGMLPYALWGGPFTVANAWFESVSGFTTTGATILDNVEALPDSLLFWRSSTHFIGGLGVVVFLLLIIPNASPVKMKLTNMELSSLSREGYNSRTNKTVYIFAYVYLGLVVISFVSYLLAGMSPLDAICHAFSVSATGGFSTRNASISAYDSRLIEGLTMVFMYLSSIHFGLIYLAVIGHSLRPLNNPVLKFYTICLLLFAIVVSISSGTSLWNSAFHTLCIASTTGFAIVDNSTFPLFTNVALMFLAVMCGCAGSTTGGVKADRVMVFFKSIGRQIGKILHPSSVNEVKLGGRILRDEDVYPQILYIALYFLIIVASVLLCLLVGVNGHSAVAATISSIGNVGPAIEELGSMSSFNSIPDIAKVFFSIDMFLGRVEIFPILAVIGMIFTSKKK